MPGAGTKRQDKETRQDKGVIVLTMGVVVKTMSKDSVKYVKVGYGHQQCVTIMVTMLKMCILSKNA